MAHVSKKLKQDISPIKNIIADEILISKISKIWETRDVIKSIFHQPTTILWIESVKDKNLYIANQFKKAIYNNVKNDFSILNKIKSTNEILSDELITEIIKNEINNIVSFTCLLKLNIGTIIENAKSAKELENNSKNKRQNEIGFWKGNFFGTKEEKEKYKNNYEYVDNKIQYLEIDENFDAQNNIELKIESFLDI